MFRELFENALNQLWSGFHELGGTYREHAAMFAREADPHISRLTQSSAFVIASILEQLEDDGQSLLRPLLAHALPWCLRPRASSTILEMPVSKVRSTDARGARFDAHGMPFRVTWPVIPGPYELVNVCVQRPHAKLQTLHLSLQGRDSALLGTVLPERLRFFVRLEPASAAIDLIHALHAANQPIALKAFDVAGQSLGTRELPRSAFQWVSVDSDEPPLSSAPSGRFRSSAQLDDLFAFPEGRSFFEVGARVFCPENVARLELILPLARVVEHAATLNLTNVRLFCAPAINEFECALEPLNTRNTREWMLLPAERHHSEVLHVVSAHAETQQGDIPLLSLEAPEHPHTLEPGSVYYRLRQSIARDESRTEMRLSLATRDGFRAPAPGPIIQARVVASDGARTSTLGLRDVAGLNITRVAPSRRAVLDRQLPRRLNAYARMSPRQLAEPEHLNAFVELHAFMAAATPRFVGMTHHPGRRALPGGCLQNVDEFKLWIDSAACNDGEAYLICKWISDAFADQNELVRASQTTVLRKAEIFAQYGILNGQRCSFPLG